MSSKKRSLDLYLGEVFKQFISIKDDDFKKSQNVFKTVFDQVKQKMGEQCNYFKKYSSQVMYGGSVSDNIKVGKMDEFDMDIVIRLPISYSDIIIENEEPGFVKLKITSAFDNLDKQPDWEKTHKVTREWRDSDKYLLQKRFRQWMHKIVQKALNAMEGKVTVDGDVYLLTYKESGPAYTLNIRNDEGTEKYALDVDLVPVIKFMYPRAPEGYSYYIKSLFLKKVYETQDKVYWQNKVSLLFRTMVEELYLSIQKKEIPFFWNCNHNLIAGLKESLQKIYCHKLRNVIVAIDANDIEKVVRALLTAEEMREFKKSEFYLKHGELEPLMTSTSASSLESCPPDSALSSQLRALTDELDSLRYNNVSDQKIEELEGKLKRLGDRVSLLERRMNRIEMALSQTQLSRSSVG
ncbi:hypothetical protein HF086_005164 [Spodoptera exigua]|uniref:Mab-21-like nucleotidyltransferase domain-containing protein n=1 Tax=Spodoptera exigua TaxID=7107 RepID=A0A922MU64_SPOEX|nr:hypothetical protein HF086_005164 [Spodoptera exigua]